MLDIYELAKPIKLVIFDVDGVLTDAQLYIGSDLTEFKSFHTQDGLGMQMLLKTQVEIGVITAHESPIITTRMERLGVKHVYQGNITKIPAYENLIRKLNLKDEQVAYVGDDVTDLHLIRRVGLGMTVINAHEFIKPHAKYITQNRGGNGAVREVCDLIMKAQGSYQEMYDAYL